MRALMLLALLAPVASAQPRPPAVEAGSGRQLIAAKRLLPLGKKLWLPVWLVEPDGVTKASFELRYDPAQVRVLDVRKGSALDERVQFSADRREAGRLRLGLSGALTRGGICVFVQFQAIGKQGTRVALPLKVAEVRGAAGALPLEVVAGELLLVDRSGRVRGDDNGDRRLDAVDAMAALQMSAGLRAVDLNLDINGDGKVTSADARIILQRAAPR